MKPYNGVKIIFLLFATIFYLLFYFNIKHLIPYKCVKTNDYNKQM